MTGTARLLQRHPWIISTPGFHYVWASLDHTTTYYMACMIILWELSFSYGCWPNRLSYLFLQLCIVGQCNVFELLDDMLGVLCVHLIKLMMKYDWHCYDPED
jgi:hypothetical protein